MTLLYDAENDFCDRHPSLCSDAVKPAELEQECFTYEDLTDNDKPEFCQI